LGGSTETRAGYRAELIEYYSAYIDLLMQHGERDRAFEVLELSRARALVELLSSAHVDLAKGSDPTLLEDLRRLQRQISAKSEERAALLTSKDSETQIKALEKEISALTAQAGEMEGRIRSALPAYSALANPRPLSLHQAQELLDPGTLLLEYALGAERSYVFAVSADSLQAFPLPGRQEVDKAARRIYSLLAARNQIVPGEQDVQRERRLRRAQAELPAALAELSRMVLGPVSRQLGNKRLIVAADGALNYIPFAMLPEISPKPEMGRPAAPLVVRHEIVNLPSISVLAVLRRQEADRHPAGKAVAVFADPVFEKTDSRIKQPDAGGKLRASETAAYSLSANLLTRSAGDLGLSRNGELSLPRLLFSRQEAEAIRAVTPRDQIREAVDFQASRSAALSPDLRDYRIVHFATHGLVNSEHPELSGLVLSLVDQHGQPQDGFLQLQDIYNLHLSAELVVLSACETGLGKEINGEGIIGLTRGFMHAGASRVVASLWNVSDAATAKLMAEFYRAMEKDHMPPAAALRTAQIQMWKQKRWTSPYYWAAFQIQGEWK
jgi:CHAT domain-containing protein